MMRFTVLPGLVRDTLDPVILAVVKLGQLTREYVLLNEDDA